MSRRPDMVKAMYTLVLVLQGYRRGSSMRGEGGGGACFGCIYFSIPPNLNGTPPPLAYIKTKKTKTKDGSVGPDDNITEALGVPEAQALAERTVYSGFLHRRAVQKYPLCGPT